ncbi:AAA family ATPase [Thauera sp.]|uniref:AAA family ATPase n=1 Tax=Thauera sp. TaxID=1905334 RepID=UPI00257E635A|nr:AAA family ATPase [Thauera sp.]
MTQDGSIRLKKVALRDFRCFEDLELELHPRLTVLVGENGAGKTAILDAIASAISPVLTYLSSANQRLSGRGIQDGDFRVVQWPQFGGKARWGMADITHLQVETYDGLAWDVWRASTKGQKPAWSIGQTELKHHLQKISDSYVTEHPRLTPVIAYYGARRGYIDVPQRLRPAKQNYAYPAAALIGALDSMSDFREMLAWFDQEEAAELRANKGVIDEDFAESPTLVAVRIAIEELLGGAYSNPHFNRDHKFVLERKSDWAHLTVSQLSQGYQSMLALAMDFARRLSIGNPHVVYGKNQTWPQVFEEITKLEALDRSFSSEVAMDSTSALRPALSLSAPAIMMVDEIDVHLHPTWQQRVLGDLMRTFPLTQFIVTTHSPQVLTTVPSECIRILRSNKVHAAPAGTEGAEPQRLLKQVLGLPDVRPPTTPITVELKEYMSLVDQDRWNTPRALELRQKLDAHFQGEEPALLDADLQIENRKWELGE